MPMFLTEVSNGWRGTTVIQEQKQRTREYVYRVMHRFVRPETPVSVGVPRPRLPRGPCPREHSIMPGHAIESMVVGAALGTSAERQSYCRKGRTR